MLYEVITSRRFRYQRGRMGRGRATEPVVITSYSIHYTKLYEPTKTRRLTAKAMDPDPEQFVPRRRGHGQAVEQVQLLAGASDRIAEAFSSQSHVADRFGSRADLS